LVSEPDELAGWLGEEVELDMQPGGTGRIVDAGEERLVVVEQIDEGRRLSYVWWPTDAPEDVSRVELVVVAAPAGSRVVVTETAVGLDAFAMAGRWSARGAGIQAGAARGADIQVCAMRSQR